MTSKDLKELNKVITIFSVTHFSFLLIASILISSFTLYFSSLSSHCVTSSPSTANPPFSKQATTDNSQSRQNYMVSCMPLYVRTGNCLYRIFRLVHKAKHHIKLEINWGSSVNKNNNFINHMIEDTYDVNL